MKFTLGLRASSHTTCFCVLLHCFWTVYVDMYLTTVSMSCFVQIENAQPWLVSSFISVPLYLDFFFLVLKAKACSVWTTAHKHNLNSSQVTLNYTVHSTCKCMYYKIKCNQFNITVLILSMQKYELKSLCCLYVLVYRISTVFSSVSFTYIQNHLQI